MKKKRSQIKPACLDCPYYTVETIDYNSYCPIFSLRYMRKKYSLSNCTSEEKQAFVDQMIKLSQLTWVKINQANRHGLGMEKVCGTKEFIRLMADAIFDKIEDEEEAVEHMICFMLKLNESVKNVPEVNAAA